MQFHPNELFLIYDPHSTLGKQTKCMVMDMCSHINEVDVIHERLSPTYWKEIVNLLGMEPDELLDHSHPEYQNKVSNHGYTMDGWLEVLVHYGYLINHPIVVHNGGAVCCQTPTDALKLKSPPNTKVMPHLKTHQGR